MNSLSEAVCQRAKGLSIGASILGFFGGVWLCWGLTLWGIPLAAAVIGALAGATVLIMLGARIRRRLLSITFVETAERKRKDRWFHAINAAQWIAIFVTVNVLRNTGHAAWTVSSVALIVGLHFLPLAWVFDSAQHAWTGVAMIGWVSMCALLPAAMRDAAMCTGEGAILWASAALALRPAGLAVRATAPVAHGVGSLPAAARGE